MIKFTGFLKSNSKFNRREFLQVGIISLGLAACQRLGVSNTTSSSTMIDNSSTFISPTNTSSSTTGQSTISPLSDQLPFIIIDGHEDIAWNALEFGRDPIKSAFDIRKEEGGTDIPTIVGERLTGLPEWLSGKLGIIFATIFVLPTRRAYSDWHYMTYTTPKQANEKAQLQLQYYQQLVEKEPRLKLITSTIDLDNVLLSWAPNSLNPKIGLVLSMEGADPILEPDDLHIWYQSGVRIIGLAWEATRYAAGTHTPGPLTALGRKLLTRMAEKNMILDLSHIAEEAYFKAMDAYPGPVIASHSNPRQYIPNDRGLSDKMIKRLAEKRGVMGIVPYDYFLMPGWVRGTPRKKVSLSIVADVIDYSIQLIGNAEHIAIGSDFDGGFGLDSIPIEMNSVADLINIADVLGKRGYKDKDIRAILYGNWLRILRTSFLTRNGFDM